MSLYIGVDGEGVEGHSPEEPNHKYVLLAAASRPDADAEETKNRSVHWYVENPKGLSTEECLQFLVNLPNEKAKIFAYSFNYDLTKILTDVDEATLYFLFRPECRQRTGTQGRQGPYPVEWRGFYLNLQGTKFTVEYRHRTVTVWDIWKFYQSKFVAALIDWKVGHTELYKRMTGMKNKRAHFCLGDLEEIRTYCLEECECMAELGYRLDRAHKDAGLELKTYYGAGSSATAMLKKMGIREKLVEVPREILPEVASAFFGGRFENSVLGMRMGDVYNYDISSAYPYQITFLPCLLHGSWKWTDDERDLESVRVALVHYGMNPKCPPDSWAPFPFRETDGSICYPAWSPGGWLWSDEYKAGVAGWPDLVVFRGAWLYDLDCDCQPFREVPLYYIERVRIGKEGPGLVIKGGCNSLYGKAAQSIGSAPFNNWIWAGLITSGCRAQLLRLIASAADRKDILMAATDGIQSKVKLEPELPRDTGTFGCMKDGKPVPLGGWEEDKLKGNGVFYARPGIYFPLSPTKDDLKKIKGRGIGRGIVLDNWKKIEETFRTYGGKRSVKIHGIERFCGAKTSISYSPLRREFTRARSSWRTDERGECVRTDPAYGEWIRRVVVMSFDPHPKRAGILGGSPLLKRLALRTIPEGRESMPYPKAFEEESLPSLLTSEAEAMRAMTEVIAEQPDPDFEVREA